MTHEELVDRVARAICNAPWHFGSGPEICIDMAEAAIAEVLAVLKEPTETMLDASEREWDGRMSFRATGAWQAMLSASPAAMEDR